MYCVGDAVIKREKDFVNRFNSAIFLYLSQTISNVICRGFFSAFSELSWEVIVCLVDIGGIVDH